jgi:hypothetical protein
MRAMAIPMCDGRRHIFIVGRERCQCGAAEAANLDPRETRISGLVAKETWSTVAVRFLLCPGRVEVRAECRRCGQQFAPALGISAEDWKHMRSTRVAAQQAQRAVAEQLVKIVNERPCQCRAASLWERQGLKS